MKEGKRKRSVDKKKTVNKIVKNQDTKEVHLNCYQLYRTFIENIKKEPDNINLIYQILDKYNKYNMWKRLYNHQFIEILVRVPHYHKDYNNIIKEIIEAADKHNIWNELNGYCWKRGLIDTNPFLRSIIIEKCNKYNGWLILTSHEWVELLILYPYFPEIDIIKKCIESGGLNKIYRSDMNGYNLIKKILDKQISLVFFIDFSNYKHNVNLIREYGYLINAYNSLENYSNFVNYIEKNIENIEQLKNYIDIITNNLNLEKIKKKIGVDILNIKLLINKTNNLEIIKRAIKAREKKEIKINYKM